MVCDLLLATFPQKSRICCLFKITAFHNMHVGCIRLAAKYSVVLKFITYYCYCYCYCLLLQIFKSAHFVPLVIFFLSASTTTAYCSDLSGDCESCSLKWLLLLFNAILITLALSVDFVSFLQQLYYVVYSQPTCSTNMVTHASQQRTYVKLQWFRGSNAGMLKSTVQPSNVWSLLLCSNLSV